MSLPYGMIAGPGMDPRTLNAGNLLYTYGNSVMSFPNFTAGYGQGQRVKNSEETTPSDKATAASTQLRSVNWRNCRGDNTHFQGQTSARVVSFYLLTHIVNIHVVLTFMRFYLLTPCMKPQSVTIQTLAPAIHNVVQYALPILVSLWSSCTDKILFTLWSTVWTAERERDLQPISAMRSSWFTYRTRLLSIAFKTVCYLWNYFTTSKLPIQRNIWEHEFVDKICWLVWTMGLLCRVYHILHC